MENFYTLITSIGKAKLSNASLLGENVNLTEIVLGDGNGSYYEINEDQTSLRNEVYRGNINSIKQDENNANWVVVESIIPSEVGGFTIREAGVIDDQGNLIVIAKYPETFKPVVDQGSSKDLKIKMIIETTNINSLEMKIDPNIIIATKSQIDELNNKIDELSGPGRTNETVIGNNLEIIGLKEEISNMDYKILKENFLNLLIERELDGLSTEMDVGYWWDTFADESKILSKTNINIDTQNHEANLIAAAGEIITQEIDLGFNTNQVRVFFERSNTNENIILKTEASIGDVELTMEQYKIIINEV